MKIDEIDERLIQQMMPISPSINDYIVLEYYHRTLLKLRDSLNE